MSKNILLLGGAGLLGGALLDQLTKGNRVFALEHHSPINRHSANQQTVRFDLNQRGETAGFFEKERIDLTINCAGATDVDRCETEHEYAHLGNTEVVNDLIRLARHHRFHLMQISTDYIFSGADGPNREDDKPGPVNFYGRTKLLAEQAILSERIRATIVRVCALYSLDPSAEANLFSRVADRLRNDRKVSAAADLWTTPTEVGDLAQAIVEMIARDRLPDKLHLAPPEHISRYQFALNVAKRLSRDPDLIQPVSLEDLRLAAPRPKKAGLVSNLAPILLGRPLKSLRELAASQ